MRKLGIKRSDSGFEPARQMVQFFGVKAFVIAALYFEHNADLAPFGQEYMVINKTEQVDERVHCA